MVPGPQKAWFGLQGDNKSIPDVSTWNLSPDSKFVHYCDNETVHGVEFMGAPDVGDRLLCGDFSSDFLSKPIDISKYAVVYGGSSRFLFKSALQCIAACLYACCTSVIMLVPHRWM